MSEADAFLPSTDRELLAVRETLYWVIAAAFTEPQSERFMLLREAHFRDLALGAAQTLRQCASRQSLRLLGPGELAPSQLDLGSLFAALPPDTAGAQDEYARVFGFTMPKECPPYSVEYCANDNLYYRSQRLADVAGFYRAFGLDRSEQHRDREDHIVYLAEFMAFLLSKIRYAEHQNHPADQRQLVADAARTFFTEHCGWWWPAFACLVQRKAGASTFYGCVADVLRRFTVWERHVHSVPPIDGCPEPKVATFEGGGTCFTCGIAQQPA